MQPEISEDPRSAIYPDRFKHREELEAILFGWPRKRGTQEVMGVLG